MARNFRSTKRRRQVEDEGWEYIQNFWKFVRIDVEVMMKKMDVGHPDRWKSLDLAVKYLTDIQQMRAHYEEMAEEADIEENSKN